MVRVLVFVYEEQEGFVKLAGVKSVGFKLTNGTRQGSVLSPFIFSIYLDGLIKNLRQLGLGCHIDGVWLGCCGYADDLILMAPSREAMAKMLMVCENYANAHNLEFSTDPVPAKSKTKCLYMCGRLSNFSYPAKLLLNGRPLPWVETATHLGHELHQNCNMDYDAKVKRAKFIDTSVDIRTMFSFAEPVQVLQAVRIYACHHYGSMLWDLNSENSGQYYRAWSTCVKLTFNVPRSTHTYLVENLLASEFIPIKTELMARYGNFFISLTKSKSFEVQFLADIVCQDIRTTTAKNLALVRSESGIDSFTVPASLVRRNVKLTEIPVNHEWRLSLLEKLLAQRKVMESELQEITTLSQTIDSLCSS